MANARQQRNVFAHELFAVTAPAWKVGFAWWAKDIACAFPAMR
jgi:hypothetical protein